MNTARLETSSRMLVAEARRGGRMEQPPDGGWASAQVVAHLIAANRCMAQLLAIVLAGVESAPYSSRATGQRDYLEAITGSAGDWDRLIYTFEQSSQELISMVARLDDRTAATPIDVVLWEDDAVVLDKRMPLNDLLEIINAHAAGHTEQLAELLRTPTT